MNNFNGMSNHQYGGQNGFSGYLSGGISGSPATNLGMMQSTSNGALSPPPTQSALSGSQNSLFDGIYGNLLISFSKEQHSLLNFLKMYSKLPTTTITTPLFISKHQARAGRSASRMASSRLTSITAISIATITTTPITITILTVAVSTI